MLIENIFLPRNLLAKANVNLLDNKITVLIGNNGSGKTTLLNYLAARLNDVSYLPQQNKVYDEIKVSDMLALAQKKAKEPLNVDVINLLDLESLFEKNLQTLSGGQQQRVWIAFVLLQNRKVVLLDEPLNALDLRYQQRLLTILPKIKATFLLVLHDLNYTYQIANYVWTLHDGTFNQGTKDKILTSINLSKMFKTDVRKLKTNDGTIFFKF